VKTKRRRRRRRRRRNEPSALVALMSWRETDRPKKAVRLSTVEPRMPRPSPMIPPTLVKLFKSNTFFRINTTFPFILFPLWIRPDTPENIFATHQNYV